MPDEPFDYEIITTLYDSSGVLQNTGSFTHYTAAKLLRLRDDIDTLGELLDQTGMNWTNFNYDWTKGDRYNLDDHTIFWKSYITDMRDACEDLATTAGIAAPTWTIATIKNLYIGGQTATISGTVLTQPGMDTSDVTNSTDYCYVQKGTSATRGRHLITAHSGATVTMPDYSGDSATGDVHFEILLDANKGNYTDVRLVSLVEDIQGAVLDIADAAGVFDIWVDAVNGNDTTGDGSRATPYKTWNKAVTVCNATPGNIILLFGEYVGNKAITVDDVIVSGIAIDDVLIDMITSGGAPIADNADNVQVRNIYFGDGTTQGQHFFECTNIVIDNCVFRGGSAGGSWGFNVRDTGTTINHCTFINNNSTVGNGLRTVGTGVYTVTLNNCTFQDFEDCVDSTSATNATITANYCNFEEYDNIHVGAATFTKPNEHISSTEPNILNVDPAYLYDTSDLIGAGSDSNDIGAYPAGVYNVKRTATDTATVSDAAEMALTEPATDEVVIAEDLASVNMNVSIDMYCPGLFFSSTGGVVSYLTSGDITPPPGLPDYDYNGGFIDCSWDNTGGDLCRVYIVVDDGVTDYSPVAWWVNNTSPANAAISTTQTNGTRGYGIDLNENGETGDEWGDEGSFSTVTSDGVNDQQWDLDLKLRVHNTITDQWSEVESLSTTYNFNTFEGTMYYCADNPRVIDDEYADHANYYANTYHSGTNKYTRPDGVDWADDGRRFAFNPMFKIGHHLRDISYLSEDPVISSQVYIGWQDRKGGSLQPFGTNVRISNNIVFTCVFNNYGNWNTSGGHCFADKDNNPIDNGIGRETNPPFGSGATDPHYGIIQIHWGTDCDPHPSHQTAIVQFPSGELVAWGDWVGKDQKRLPSDFKFETGDHTSPGCPPSILKWFRMRTDETFSFPSGFTSNKQVKEEVRANGTGGGGAQFGVLNTLYLYQA